MINFKQITAEGFTSLVEPSTFELGRGESLNVIRGKVGSGKTTIPNALTWCLYGQTLKNKCTIEPWEEVRTDKYRGTKVSVEFEKFGEHYEIIRCKNFKGNITIGPKTKIKGGSNIIILKDGELISGKGKVLAQQEINDILGYSFELFKNSIVFGQNMKRIIEETGPEKKKVFDEAFQVDFIDKAKDNVSDEKKKLLELKKDIIHDIELIDERLSKFQSKLDFALDNEKSFDENNKERITEYNDNIKELKSDIESIKKEETYEVDTKTLEETKTELLKEKNRISINNDNFLKIEKDITTFHKEETEIKSQLKKGFEKCPTCGGKMNKDKASEMVSKLNKRLKVVEKTLSVLKKQYMSIEHIDNTEITNKLRNIETRIAEAKANNKWAQNSKNRIEKNKEKIAYYTEKINEVNNRKLLIKSTMYEKLSNKQVRISKKLHNRLATIERDIEIKDWLISDPLSNNGLKAYIFDALLGNVNDRLNTYEPILGFQVEFGIDLTSHRKDFYQAIMKDGIVIAYDDLSGGQKQLVNTAVAFAIHDVISELRPMNILFLDEPFESLDVDYIEIISDLVYEKSKNKSLYLITHHQSFSPTNINEISVSIEDGKTKID